MTTFRRGDVVLVEYVFAEGTQSKKRPAVVLSRDEYHKGRQDVLLVAVTSNVTRALIGDTKIEEWQKAGLKFPFLVTGIVQTMKSSMIIKKLGSLTDGDFQRVQHNLRHAMGFDS